MTGPFSYAGKHVVVTGGANSVCPAPIDTPLLADFKATMGENVLG